MPKRAPSAYNIFVKDVMNDVRDANPGMSLGECMKKCSAQWKALSAGAKEEYKEKSSRAKMKLKAQREEMTSGDDLSGSIARLEKAISGMRSSPKKSELKSCLADLKKYL